MKCVEECLAHQAPCCSESCKFWINYSEDLNCTLVCVKSHGALTLMEAAKRLGVSHVRVKQIQDKAIIKMNKKILEKL
tara:strand:- start:327 stop:560 length:234 start_codon:yes stop_codon:yes gene_type:complete